MDEDTQPLLLVRIGRDAHRTCPLAQDRCPSLFQRLVTRSPSARLRSDHDRCHAPCAGSARNAACDQGQAGRRHGARRVRHGRCGPVDRGVARSLGVGVTDMINVPTVARILLASQPIDSLKGAHGLAALASRLGHQRYRADLEAAAAGARAYAADRRRHPDQGDGRACAGGPLCRPSAAVSPGADPEAAARQSR